MNSLFDDSWQLRYSFWNNILRNELTRTTTTTNFVQRISPSFVPEQALEPLLLYSEHLVNYTISHSRT